MKKIIILPLIFVAANIWAQSPCEMWYEIDFEENFCIHHLTIDTINFPNNIWQIGAPQKPVLNNALSQPNVIITDTLKSYPANDTSVFVVNHYATGYGFQWPHTVVLAGNFYVNSDSLNDYGMLEFSPDNGSTWIDLINDTIYNSFYYWNLSTPPVLTGNSDGWEHFSVYLAELGPVFNIQYGDTVKYRFTFISDSIEDNMDGLMFDDLHFEDWVESIDEYRSGTIYSSVFPNPSSQSLTIEFDNQNSSTFQLTIFNNIGICIHQDQKITSNQISLNIYNYPPGLYFYKLYNERDRLKATGRFIIQK